MKHLLVDISGHGFGHLSQTAAVLNELAVVLESTQHRLKITIRSKLPQAIIKERVQSSFSYLCHEQDKGMVMKDPIHVDTESSFRWYQDRHERYSHFIKVEIRQLETLKPDLIFANIPYLSLEAGHRLSIPCIALCSLNWYEILNNYCGAKPGFSTTLKQISLAYSRTECFLRPEPSLAMHNLKNTKSIAPIATKGFSQRQKLFDQIPDHSGEKKFILVSLGGIPADYSTQDWPVIKGVYWIVPAHCHAKEGKICRDDILYQSNIDLSFIDLLASVDLVITKTGYGTLVEAVSHQKPLICVERGDWPEENVLFPWCQQHGYLKIITYDDLLKGNFINAVQTLLSQRWCKQEVVANGARQAAQIIIDRIY